MVSNLFATPGARYLFLAQFEDIGPGCDLALHVCDRVTAADEAHLREQVRVLKQLIVELREVWSLSAECPGGGEARHRAGERGLGARLAELPKDGDLLPDYAITAIEAKRNDERNVAVLRSRITQLERGRAADMDWLRETLATEPSERAVESIRRMLGIHAEVAERIERHRPNLERLASGADDALVCGTCGRAISQLAGYAGRLLANTHFPGTCGVCGQIGSVSPSDDWIGEGD